MRSYVSRLKLNSASLFPFYLLALACSLWPELELLVPSFPSMKLVFDVDDGQIQQLLSVNFFGFLVGVLFAGPLCDSVGRRVVMSYGMLGYLLASFAAVMATDFSFLMVARFFQGVLMTGPVVAGGVILLEVTSGASQVFWMAISSSAITFCMAMGPIVGAWINDSFGYSGNLWSIFILGLTCSLPALLFVPESLAAEKRTRLRLPMLLKGYWTLLCDWQFMCFALPMCLLSGAYWVYVGVSALFLVDHLGLPAASFGSYQGPIVGSFSIVSLSSSWLLRRFGLMRMVKVGVFLMFVGCLPLFVMSVVGFESAKLTTFFMMLFVGGMAPVCSTLFPISLNHLPPELQGNGQAFIHALRMLFASIGTFILGFVYKGPLLPVMCILLVMLIPSAVSLWLGRKFLVNPVEGFKNVGGH